MRKYLSTIFTFAFFVQITHGQNLKFYRPIGDISQNSITSIVQDHQGFLWFGTKYGLNQYNGVAFHTFLHNKDEENGLTNSSIECLMIDSEQNIWVGTFGGKKIKKMNYLLIIISAKWCRTSKA